MKSLLHHTQLQTLTFEKKSRQRERLSLGDRLLRKTGSFKTAPYHTVPDRTRPYFISSVKLIQVATTFLWSTLPFDFLIATLFLRVMIGILLRRASYFEF